MYNWLPHHSLLLCNFISFIPTHYWQAIEEIWQLLCAIIYTEYTSTWATHVLVALAKMRSDVTGYNCTYLVLTEQYICCDFNCVCEWYSAGQPEITMVTSSHIMIALTVAARITLANWSHSKSHQWLQQGQPELTGVTLSCIQQLQWTMFCVLALAFTFLSSCITPCAFK